MRLCLVAGSPSRWQAGLTYIRALNESVTLGERSPVCTPDSATRFCRRVLRRKNSGKALSRARELAELYLKAPEVTRRNTRVHFIQPLKERIVREVGYGLSLEGASAADLVKSMQAKGEAVARRGKSE
jgi:hypothetical protein